jgi:hypothetical protein
MLETFAALLFVALADPTDTEAPPTQKEMAAITERGRNLAQYDAAAWIASDAFMAKKPKQELVGRYIARKTGKVWIVDFGKLDDAQTKFLVAYRATQGEDDPKRFEVKEHDPPIADAGFNLAASHAIDLALKDFVKHFEGEQRPYNAAVLPDGATGLWVYLVPAATKAGVWPLGGDVRYRMSADGGKILEKRQLHRSVIDRAAPENGPNGQLAMGVHTHVLDDMPEDTDVFHVLTRRPTAPELIRTKKFVFQVEVDGNIKYLGTPETVFKQ